MLVKLLPDQISSNWSTIRWAFGQSAPAFVDLKEENYKAILNALLIDRMQAWAVMDESKLVGIALTTIVEDACLKTKDILIYCLYGMDKFSTKLWDDSFKQMSEFALAIGCTGMTAFTNVYKIEEMCLRMGGRNLTYCVIPLRRP